MHESSSRQEMSHLQLSTTQREDKSTFLVADDTEDDFIARTFHKKLNFEGVDMSSRMLHRESSSNIGNTDSKCKFNIFYDNDESQNESMIVHS